MTRDCCDAVAGILEGTVELWDGNLDEYPDDEEERLCAELKEIAKRVRKEGTDEADG